MWERFSAWPAALKGLPERYRKPVNDGIVCSGISGYLNILDIPTFSKELALLGYRLSGEERLPAWRKALRTEIHFDFELPGSTHNMRVSDPFFCALSHSGDQAFSGSGSLKNSGGDRMVRGDRVQRYFTSRSIRVMIFRMRDTVQYSHRLHIRGRPYR